MWTLAQTLRPTPTTSAYVVVVAGLAAVGFATESAAAILLAVLLALPSSVPAVVGFYLVYGLLAQVPGANPSSSSGSASCTSSGECQSSSTGDLAGWFSLTTDLLGVVALAAAAILNMAVLRHAPEQAPNLVGGDAHVGHPPTVGVRRRLEDRVVDRPGAG